MALTRDFKQTIVERVRRDPAFARALLDEAAMTGMTYPAANQLVERLVKIGILAEITGQARNRRFRYDAYVQLFDEPDSGAGGAAA